MLLDRHEIQVEDSMNLFIHRKLQSHKGAASDRTKMRPRSRLLTTVTRVGGKNLEQ